MAGGRLSIHRWLRALDQRDSPKQKHLVYSVTDPLQRAGYVARGSATKIELTFSVRGLGSYKSGVGCGREIHETETKRED